MPISVPGTPLQQCVTTSSGAVAPPTPTPSPYQLAKQYASQYCHCSGMFPGSAIVPLYTWQHLTPDMQDYTVRQMAINTVPSLLGGETTIWLAIGNCNNTIAGGYIDFTAVSDLIKCSQTTYDPCQQLGTGSCPYVIVCTAWQINQQQLESYMQNEFSKLGAQYFQQRGVTPSTTVLVCYNGQVIGSIPGSVLVGQSTPTPTSTSASSTQPSPTISTTPTQSQCLPPAECISMGGICLGACSFSPIYTCYCRLHEVTPF